MDSELLNNAEAVKDIGAFGDELMHFVLPYRYEPFGGRILWFKEMFGSVS